MSLCRVDTDRLRGLASHLGSTAEALGDAAPAADLLAVNGAASPATSVAAALLHGVEFLSRWQASLVARAAILDQEHSIFAAPTLSTADLLRRHQIGAGLATHMTAATPLPSPRRRGADLAAAAAGVVQLAADQAPPADVAASFAGMGGDLAAMVAAAEPETVGSLGGVPLPLRFLANRLLIGRARAAAHQALQHGEDAVRTGREELAVLDRLDDGTRRFVLFDWERRHIVEWIGPPDATNVAVYLPGAGVRAAQYLDLAVQLERLVQLDATDGDLAVVAALAYDTPPTIPHAALGHYADRGGPEIVALLEGIELTDRHVTLVAHSYGAVVLGEALHLGVADALPQDPDIVVMGAPGMRADHVSELGVAGDRLWVALLPGDEIVGAVHPSVLPGLAACTTTGLIRALRSCAAGDRLLHGVNPASPAFGGSVLQVESTDHGSGHADYLAIGVVDGEPRPSPVVRELIRILVGQAGGGG